jgi:hypothetical protein
MRSVAVVIGVCLVGLQCNVASASEQPVQSLDALEFMTGCWQGEGWSSQRAELKKFKSSELVEFKAGRTVLAITGRHFDIDTSKVVHDAFAIVNRAKEGDGYRFASFLGSGQSGQYAASLKDGAFVWELPVPNGGTVRYSIRIEQDAWAETGHYSPDGKQWHETFGMKLKRVRPSDACLNEP